MSAGICAQLPQFQEEGGSLMVPKFPNSNLLTLPAKQRALCANLHASPGFKGQLYQPTHTAAGTVLDSMGTTEHCQETANDVRPPLYLCHVLSIVHRSLPRLYIWTPIIDL